MSAFMTLSDSVLSVCATPGVMGRVVHSPPYRSVNVSTNWPDVSEVAAVCATSMVCTSCTWLTVSGSSPLGHCRSEQS